MDYKSTIYEEVWRTQDSIMNYMMTFFNAKSNVAEEFMTDYHKQK